MKTVDISVYLQRLFDNNSLVTCSAIVSCMYTFFFPTAQYLYGAAAVLGLMVLDLMTKLFALERQSGGMRAALLTRKINSSSFLRGTMDKLAVFGVMMIICGFAYRLTIIDSVAVWFTQMVFILMFLRDALSIIENLSDAGVEGLGMFKKLIKKKMSDYVELGEEIESAAPQKSTEGDKPI